MNPIDQFKQEVQQNIAVLSQQKELHTLSNNWLTQIAGYKYSYNFSWMGRPIIQLPQDMVAMQELIWQIKPDLIIETGIAHGGSLIFSASMLALLEMEEAIALGNTLDPCQPKRRVLGIDIDIRQHNRAAIEAHPMAHRIDMIQGSSIDSAIIAQVKALAAPYKNILVCLDSNHTHEHVLAELQAYASLTGVGSYCVVFDTAIEDLPVELFGDRPWAPGNSPKTAVWEFLKSHPEFEIDKNIDHKLLITVAPDGYLKRIY
jgi:cephalosporin hydroxylase